MDASIQQVFAGHLVQPARTKPSKRDDKHKRAFATELVETRPEKPDERALPNGPHELEHEEGIGARVDVVG